MRWRRWAAAVVAITLVTALSACGLFVRDPPESVSSAVDDAVAGLRDIAGINTVSSWVSVGSGDDVPLKYPSAWRARITVDAAPEAAGLQTLAASVDDALAIARRGVATHGTLRLRADRHGAGVVLELPHNSTSGSADSTGSARESAAAALQLRALSGVTEVFVTRGAPRTSMAVSSPAEWSRSAAELRQLPGFGHGALSSVAVSGARSTPRGTPSRITVDAASPSPALIAVLSGLAGRDDVSGLWYTGTQGGTVDQASTTRDELRVEVDSIAAVLSTARILAELEQTVAATAGLPLTAFHVSYRGENAQSELEGYLGLPLGSAEPDDLAPDPEDTPLAVVLDPGDAAARLDSDRLATAALLADAGERAGIQGTPEIWSAPCESESGQEVWGRGTLPIFEIADSAQDAFDAVVASWTSNGFTRSDRASGTDFYTAEDARPGGVKTLAIRGTAEGISISSTSTCVISR